MRIKRSPNRRKNKKSSTMRRTRWLETKRRCNRLLSSSMKPRSLIPQPSRVTAVAETIEETTIEATTVAAPESTETMVSTEVETVIKEVIIAEEATTEEAAEATTTSRTSKREATHSEEQ